MLRSLSIHNSINPKKQNRRSYPVQQVSRMMQNNVNVNGSMSNQNTPYQGNKRCFGEYSCQRCNKQWKSANSRSNESQRCTSCGQQVYPMKQRSLQSVYEDLRRDKSLKMAIIQEELRMQQAQKQCQVKTSYWPTC